MYWQERRIKLTKNNVTLSIEVHISYKSHQFQSNSLQSILFRDDKLFRTKRVIQPESCLPHLLTQLREMSTTHVAARVVTARKFQKFVWKNFVSSLTQNAVTCLLSIVWAGNLRRQFRVFFLNSEIWAISEPIELFLQYQTHNIKGSDCFVNNLNMERPQKKIYRFYFFFYIFLHPSSPPSYSYLVLSFVFSVLFLVVLPYLCPYSISSPLLSTLPHPSFSSSVLFIYFRLAFLFLSLYTSPLFHTSSPLSHLSS